MGRPPQDVELVNRFCANFNQIVADKNITQTEIAMKMDMSPQGVSLWITGKRIPSKKNMIRLAKVLSVSVDELK